MVSQLHYDVIGNNTFYKFKKLPKYSDDIDFPETWYDLDFFERKKFSDNGGFLYEGVQLNG